MYICFTNWNPKSFLGCKRVMRGVLRKQVWSIHILLCFLKNLLTINIRYSQLLHASLQSWCRSWLFWDRLPLLGQNTVKKRSVSQWPLLLVITPTPTIRTMHCILGKGVNFCPQATNHPIHFNYHFTVVCVCVCVCGYRCVGVWVSVCGACVCFSMLVLIELCSTCVYNI